MSVDTRFAPDLYDRLGLASSADPRDIRQRFRQLARLYHPDINPAENANERFIAVQTANEVLGDPANRQRYDEWLAKEGRISRPLVLQQHYGPTALQRDGGRQRLYLLLDLLTVPSTEATFTPLNLALVLDRSASMRGERLLQVRAAARAIAEKLSARDIFSIITFSDRAQVILPPGRGTALHVVRSALEAIEPSGGTEIAQGLGAALHQVKMAHSSDVLSHIILLTDGQTYGDEGQCLHLAQDAAAEGITITALGIGNDWNDRFLDSLASTAQGRAHLISDPSKALAIFERQLRQIQQTVASDGSLSVKLDESVEVLAAYEVAPDLRRLTLNGQKLEVGNLPSDPPLRTLLELAVIPTSRDVLLLGELTLSGRLRQPARRYQTTQPLVIGQTDDELEYLPEVVEAARYAATLRLQERAWQSVANGDVAAARRDMNFLATRFLELGRQDLAHATQTELDSLQRTGQLSPSGQKAIKFGTRLLALPSS